MSSPKAQLHDVRTVEIEGLEQLQHNLALVPAELRQYLVHLAGRHLELIGMLGEHAID